jgi:ribosome recycling factor
MFDFSSFKKILAEREEHFKTELSGVRTGRATPALLDGVSVEAYGGHLPLAQTASITTEDARTLRVTPWDASLGKAVERAISDANLGVSVGADEKGVRVFFPDLTSERRAQLVKLTRAKLEEARTAVRKAREEVWQTIQKAEKEKTLSEDEKFRAKEQMEKMVQEQNTTLETLAQKKEKELEL